MAYDLLTYGMVGKGEIIYFSRDSLLPLDPCLSMSEQYVSWRNVLYNTHVPSRKVLPIDTIYELVANREAFYISTYFHETLSCFI